jgi:hypothetical protein
LQQLLWIETLLKLAAGIALVLVPMSAIKVLGLPPAGSAFWPRLLGAVLLGLAGALYLEGSTPGASGLGLGGCLIVNFAAVTMLTVLMVFNGGPQSSRGRVAVWGLVVLLAWLSVLEIANL